MLGYLLAVFAVMVLAVIPTKLIFGDLDAIELRLQILLLGIQVMLAVAVVNVFLAKVSKSPLVREGWPDLVRGVRWFGIGILVGLLMCGGMLATTGLSGGGRLLLDRSEWSQYVRYVLPLLFYILILALGEEWVIRGYPLTKLSQVVGCGWANVVVGLLFMAMHWGGDGWSVLAAGNIFLFSLANGAMRFTPGGIPAAGGFHFAWNSLQILLGANLTGENFEVPAVRFSSAGPAWLSGGAYGPEGAIGTTVVTIIGLALVWRFMQRRDEEIT